MTLVQVRAPLHDGDRHAGERPEDERARMAERGRDGPAGDLAVGDLDRILDRVGEARRDPIPSTTAARGTSADRSLIAASVVVDHAEPSATRAS